MNVGLRFQQHVPTANARIGYAVFDISRHVAGFDQNERIPAIGGMNYQFARFQLAFFDNYPGASKNRQRIILHAAF